MLMIVKVWKDQPGKFFCISTKDRAKNWEDHFFQREDFDENVEAFIKENLDKDLYFCPHGFSGRRRLKDKAVIPKLLWADLDEVDPTSLDDIGLLPTFAWESSPGRFASIWRIDTLMTEDINQKLTYAIGADKGGWDITQVLRIPNTHNYKYVAAPKVKTLWSDGPIYETTDIEKKLPKEKKKAKTAEGAVDIYKRYEKHLSQFVRRELFKGKPRQGTRSEVIWKLVNECVECGMTRDEVFEVMRASPWNKFAGRRNGDDQLKREINKALKEHLKIIKNKDESTFEEDDLEEADDERKIFLGRSMADVEEENIDWIWYPYIARHELTIIEGDPGLGKSYLAQMICAHIVDGKELPSERHRRKPVQGSIAYFDIENSAGSVTKKRLLNNGCVNLRDYYQEEEPFSIDDEDTLDHVYQAIEKLKPKVVVFDTLNTYIGKADTHNSAEAQQAFKNFIEIARRFDCGVVVLRHLTKSSKTAAIYRGQGSIAFTGLARVVVTVGRHPEEPDTRVIAVTKINVARPPKALTYTIEPLPDKLKDTDRSQFVWGEWIDLSSDDMLIDSGRPAKPSTKDKAEEMREFLAELLKDGPMPRSHVVRAAEGRSMSIKLLTRIAEEMGLAREKQGYGENRKAMWGFPESRKERHERLSEEVDIVVKKKKA